MKSSLELGSLIHTVTKFCSSPAITGILDPAKGYIRLVPRGIAKPERPELPAMLAQGSFLWVHPVKQCLLREIR